MRNRGRAAIRKPCIRFLGLSPRFDRLHLPCAFFNAVEELRWLWASWLESRWRCCFRFLELGLSFPWLLEFLWGGGVPFTDGETGLSLETSCRMAHCTMSRTDCSLTANSVSICSFLLVFLAVLIKFSATRLEACVVAHSK